jgi:hypothetical protein
MNLLTKQEIETLLEDDDGSIIAVDDDGDAYLLPSGLPNNLLALPARDDNGAVLNALQWQNMVARFNAAPDIARTALDALARLEDAEAAQALVVERAAAKAREWAGNYSPGSDGRNTFVMYAEWIEALADPSGVAALAALRAERDELFASRERRGRIGLSLARQRNEQRSRAKKAEAERDDALTRLAAAEAQVGALIGWQPPEDRPDGYRCLGWTDDGWVVVTWVQMGRDPARWFTDWYPERDDIPTAFAPLPAPLASAAGGAK